MRLKSALALCRVSNLPTVWMNVITAAVLVGSAHQQPVSWLLVAMLALAMSAFYCAGMSLNDLCDYQWDKQHQPYRPLVQGKLSLAQAKAITLGLFVLGFALLALAPSYAGLLCALALFVVIYAYNLFHKQHSSSVFLMAAARALVFIVTAQAIVGELPLWVIVAAALQFIYTLCLTLVGRHESKRGRPYSGPVIPRMIAGMAILDGMVLALLLSAPGWLLLGAAMALLTRLGQRFVRGD
ncbi:MAG TPA: UbiA family prenyltransferase [Cellvibrio sp.]|nr:UbiA family prenyltransferase [Cellvibrio sp.]